MITKQEKEIILKCAEKYNVSSVFLFGSSIEKEEYDDIDIGVKGIKPRLFFKFYTELVKHLPKNVDLVDLSKKTLFNDLVERDMLRLTRDISPRFRSEISSYTPKSSCDSEMEQKSMVKLAEKLNHNLEI